MLTTVNANETSADFEARIVETIQRRLNQINGVPVQSTVWALTD